MGAHVLPAEVDAWQLPDDTDVALMGLMDLSRPAWVRSVVDTALDE